MRLEGMRATLIVGALVCLAESFPIQATIYAPIADDELIRRATAVAVVESLGSTVVARPGGQPETLSVFSVLETVRGTLPDTIEVGVLGGVLPNGIELVVPAVPRFQSNTKYLLALFSRADGTYGVTELALGAFDVVQDAKGRVYATRMAFRSAASAPSTLLSRSGVVSAAREPLRDLGAFVSYARAVPARSLSTVAPTYFAADRTDLKPIGAAGSDSVQWDSRWCPDGGVSCSNFSRARWTNNASASVTWCDEDPSTLGQNGVTGGGQTEFTAAMQLWNATAPQASINLSRGVDCATAECCDPAGLPTRGHIKIYLDDLSQPEFLGVAAACPSSSGGLLGIAAWLTDGTTHTWKSETWKTVVGGVGWVRKASCAADAYPSSVYENVITHLLGTTLGLSNSDLSRHPADTDPTDYLTSVMVSTYLQGRSVGLGTDDIAAACYLYGNCVSTGTVSTVLFVPIVLTVPGKANSFFTSEMTVTNRGPLPASISYLYTPAFGSGAGTVTDTVAAGKQVVIPSVIDYLRTKGLAIPTTDSQGGTLRATFSGISASSDVAITVRTATPVPPETPNGRAGLAYAGVPEVKLLGNVAYLPGLRSGTQDRTNVALENGGAPGSGDITLRATFYPADGTGPILPGVDRTIGPGGWAQVSLTDIAPNAGQGYVKIQKVLGTASFWTYAVINDNLNSDGSYILPIPEYPILCQLCRSGITLPVAVETPTFRTEVILTNVSGDAKTAQLLYVAKAITGGQTAVNIKVPAYSQIHLPDFVQVLRNMGAPGVGPIGPTFQGAVFVTTPVGNTSGLAISGRVTNSGPVGFYGVFLQGSYNGTNATGYAWLSSLRKDTENRANLAIVNTAEYDENDCTYRIEVFDGETGLKAGETTAALKAREWMQINQVVNQIAPAVKIGYSRVSRLTGQNPFICYAVVNDGANPGDRSGDGAFVPYEIP